MFVCQVLLAGFLKLMFLVNAVFKHIFLDWLRFSSHGALVSWDLIGLDEQSISRYLHTLSDKNNISHQDKILMNFHSDSISIYGHLLLFISDAIQLNELSFLLVIVDWSNKGADKDCDKDCKSLNPSFWSLWIRGSSYLRSNWEDGCADQDSEGEVLESLAEQL